MKGWGFSASLVGWDISVEDTNGPSSSGHFLWKCLSNKHRDATLHGFAGALYSVRVL